MRAPLTRTVESLSSAPQLALTASPLDVYVLPHRIQRPGKRVTRLPPSVKFGLSRRLMIHHEEQCAADAIASGSCDWAAPDLESARRLLSSAGSLYLKVASSNSALAAVEAGELEKFVFEKGLSAGWSVLPDLFARPPPRMDFDIEALNMVADAINSMAHFEPPPPTAKRGTNHSWPTYRNDHVDHLVHFAMASYLEEGLSEGGIHVVEARLAEIGAISGLNELRLPPCALLLTRTGPLRKPTVYSAFREGVLCEVAQGTGWDCRHRHVKAHPTLLNEVLRPHSWTASERLKASWLGHSFSHGSAWDNFLKVKRLQGLALETSKGIRPVSDDASNFDDSTARRHMIRVYEGLPYPQKIKELFKWLLDLPVLAGSLFEGDTAFLYQRDSGVLSGIIDTSFFDSVLNFCIAATCLRHALKMTPPSFYDGLRAGQISLLVQGDDTLIIAPTFDLDVYTTTAALLGYKRSPQSHALFLKTWMGGSKPHTLATRAFMRSCTRERRAAGQWSEALAVVVRFALCQGDPYQADAFEAFRVSPLVAACKLRGPLPGDNDIIQLTRRALEEVAASAQREQQADLLFDTLLDESGGAVTPLIDNVVKALGPLRVWASQNRVSVDSLGVDWRSYLRALRRENEGKEPLNESHG